MNPSHPRIEMTSVGRIGFLGGGKIAQAMAKGFIKAGECDEALEPLCCSVARSTEQIF